MKEREVLIGLHETEGIGWQTINRLKQAVGDLGQLVGLSRKDIAGLPIPPDRSGRRLVPKLADKIFEASREDRIAERLERLDKAGVRVVTAADSGYPERLAQIHGAPWVLYGIGNWRLLEHPVIAVVGTRLPTTYGKRVARRLAADLSDAGWCVASGLARGIDGEAHAGALAGPGGTIAVLATPVDTPYPREHADLYRRIREGGLILSETPLGVPLVKGLFPERNRIISGLSLGTVVVEADRESGSLITANYALDHNRELFAVPGPVTSPKSAGTNRLIQQSHAKLVGEAADILEEFPGQVIRSALARTDADPPAGTDEEGLTPDERLVLRYVTNEPVTFDELLAVTQFDFGHLHSVLLHLLMKKKIEQEPGSLFVRYF